MLAREWNTANQAWDIAKERLAESSASEYARIRIALEEARLDSELARLRLDRHLATTCEH
jgi:hypothetical protein